MCDKQAQQQNVLISAQNHGTILVMVVWFLACLLALCTAARIVARCRSQRLHHLSPLDDAIVFTASLCALGSTILISTAVDSGLGKRKCLLTSADVEQIQLKAFVSAILFALAISISKCSILLFLYHLAHRALQRVCIIIVSILVLLWTIAVLAGMVFQCEMPTPWDIWTGSCIPLAPFWITAIAVDIFSDSMIMLLSFHSVWTLSSDLRQRSFTTALCLLRTILIASSVVRLFYLQQAFNRTADPTFNSVPYTIITQCQTTFAVLLACSLTLQPFANLLQTSASQPRKAKSRHSKHWSGTTIGGTPYESYDSFAATAPIIREPLPSIQASMSTPNSPSASRNSLSNDILLPDIPMPPTRYIKAPPRPPPPSEEQRPDLSMFTRRTSIRQPPMVTRLGSLRRNNDGRDDKD